MLTSREALKLEYLLIMVAWHFHNLVPTLINKAIHILHLGESKHAILILSFDDFDFHIHAIWFLDMVACGMRILINTFDEISFLPNVILYIFL